MLKRLKWITALGAVLAIFQLLGRQQKIKKALEWKRSRPGTALITGASSGIGEVFARALAREGYDLILLARREERLKTLAEEITGQFPVHVEILTADLNDLTDVRQAAQRIAEVRDLDLLVNNAGFGLSESFLETDIEASLKMVRVHVMATKHLTWAALPAMVARSRGGIINVSSLAAFVPGGGMATYGATKAYLNFFSEALASELQGSGVRIQALCPGFTYTELHKTIGRPRLPSFMWMNAEDVVAESLQGLKEDRLYVIPGRVNQAIAGLMRLQPARKLAQLVRSQIKRG